MQLSIVTTLYKSAPYIREFYERSKKAAEKITQDYEIIFVDDGSPDDSSKIALDIQQVDKKVVVIDLSRNFGHHKAMMTGLGFAKGNLVFLIDSDLEEAPELLNLFYKELNNKQYDVVYGVQKKRKGSWFEQISGSIYYYILNKFTDLNIPRNIITARLMKKRYVESLIQHKEKEVLIAGLWEITGYKQLPIFVDKHDKGISSYTMSHKFSILLNSITSFSNKPLRCIFYIGLIISTISFCYIIYLFCREMFFSVPISGWLSLIVSIWFLGGLTILFIGVIGLYLSKIFTETKNRPYTIVKEIYRNE